MNTNRTYHCREDDLHDYSDRLWERYCSTGRLEAQP